MCISVQIVNSWIVYSRSPERDAFGTAGPALTRGGEAGARAMPPFSEASRRELSATHDPHALHTALALVYPRVAILSIVYCSERPTHV